MPGRVPAQARRGVLTQRRAARSSPASPLAQPLMSGLSYDWVTHVQTATGTVPMLMFSMNSMTLSGGTVLTVS